MLSLIPVVAAHDRIARLSPDVVMDSAADHFERWDPKLASESSHHYRHEWMDEVRAEWSSL
jgi:hypothetical protein